MITNVVTALLAPVRIAQANLVTTRNTLNTAHVYPLSEKMRAQLHKSPAPIVSAYVVIHLHHLGGAERYNLHMQEMGGLMSEASAVERTAVGRPI
jgi:hypothetical protein